MNANTYSIDMKGGRHKCGYTSIYVKCNRDYYVLWGIVESIMCGCVDSADRAELGAAAATHGLSAGEGPALRPATPHLNCC